MMNNNAISIYIHIPFCEQKCNYCAFNSFCASEKVKDEYVDILCKEIESRKVETKVKTIYIGGGTPSVLSESQIEKIFDAIFENYNVARDAEITVEANPNSITKNKLKKWESLKINRLSIGVQSLDDESLRKIGRLHDREMALEKIEIAKKYFENVSADLIVGLENERGDALCEYADALLKLGVKHISCYLLEVYENTKLFELVKNNKYLPLSDDQTIDAFEKLAEFLEKCGMQRYEISNFAFPGFESKHNLNYWQRGEYLGFGLSAHSFVKNVRFKNADTLTGYKNHEIQSEKLSGGEVLEEIIMLGLRCRIGVSLKELKQKNYDIQTSANFKKYLDLGILNLKNDRFFLNPKFYDVSNTIISDLLP